MPGAARVPATSNRLELSRRRWVADGRGKQNHSRVRDSGNHRVLLLGGHYRSGHHPAGGHRALGRRRRTQPQARALRAGRRLHLIASARGRAVTLVRARPRRTSQRSPPGGRTRGLAQHSQRGECPQAGRGQPDDKAKPSGLADARCLELPGQRRIRMTRGGQEAPHRRTRTVTPVPVRDKEVLFAERAVVQAVQDWVSARAGRWPSAERSTASSSEQAVLVLHDGLVRAGPDGSAADAVDLCASPQR